MERSVLILMLFLPYIQGLHYLDFIHLDDNATVLPPGDDDASAAISIPTGFPFGRVIHEKVYVVTNGFFSFGVPRTDFCPEPFLASDKPTYRVAPFWEDIETTQGGEISYQVFSSTQTADTLQRVNILINNKANTTFYGSWMLVAEWSNVPQYNQLVNLTDTFQGIVITDGSKSYAVFTYKCGLMQWSGNATIGFKADRTYFRNHPLSGSITSNSIACINYPPTEWTNVVYDLVPEGEESCVPGEFGCDNGNCISDELICNGIDDCGDNTDENGCPPGSGSCSSEDFQCDNGECIPLNWECDTIVDCNDTSDEDHCAPGSGSGSCPPYNFQCDNGQCIFFLWECDGYVDCSDGSDEDHCGNITCGFEDFHCFNGTGCIPFDWVCDDYIDCPDTSDETIFCEGCTSDEFRCNNGFCVHYVHECDGNNDCGDNSDEDACDQEENTCVALQGIMQSLEAADRDLTCTTVGPCNTMICSSPDGGVMQLTILKCNNPPAIQLAILDSKGNRLLNHTFNHSEAVHIVADELTLNVTIIHHPSILGLRIEALFDDGSRSTYVPYTLIRIDASACVPQTPTCQAMQSVAHNISQFGLVCWSSDPCEIVNCINQFGTPQLQLNILKCNDPQAVEVVMMYSQNVVWFRHIFTQSEVVPVYYSTSVMMLNVTLDHKKTGIGLSISVNTSGLFQQWVSYTTIPLDRNTCPIAGLQYLPFLNLTRSAVVLPPGDDEASAPISISTGFPFGRIVHENVYVITNGFFSFGVPSTDCCPELFSTSDLPTYRVAPFWEDIITTQGGKISYQVFSSAQTPDTLHQVSTFVSYQTNATFSGSWMLVAEWNAVPQFNGLSKLTDTFQGIVITNGSRSYAVFTYKCGLMQWSGEATIGFKADRTYYRNNPLSGTVLSNTIACINVPASNWSNVVYNLLPAGVEPCVVGEFGCDNGNCISDRLVCNGVNDCGDNTDENGCGSAGSCSPDEFQCDNGECIPYYWECDGFDDCADSSDEHCGNSTCGLFQFQCYNSTQCIPYEWECDDYIDCPDGSDEAFCRECTSDEFGCDNGLCVHFALECDGNNDCGDNSDEYYCDGLELYPCPAMQSIVSNMEVADPSFFCTTADPCNTATCVARDGQKLQITLLNCNHPTAIRLINRDRNGPVLFNHTFDHSETVPAIIGGASITLNVTIVHHSGLLGLRIEALLEEGRVTYIPYTLIRIDTTTCHPTSETPTCKAVQGVVRGLSKTGWTCWTSDPCNVVNCIDEDGEQGLQMTFLPCDKPQAVNWVMMYTRNVIWYNHTFTHSEVVTVYYSNHVLMLNVTLEQLKNGIGLGISVNTSGSGFWQPSVPYTIIPLNTSTCPKPGMHYLPFLDLGKGATVLPPGDDAASAAISIPAGFPFGRVVHENVYVVTNGFLSFGNGPPYTSCCPVVFSASTGPPTYLVAPFWEDITTTQGGQISYQEFSSAQTPDILHQVSTFVSNKTNVTFSGSWMLVAEWYKVSQYHELINLTDTFQGIVITNGSRSYAVFTYKCGSMQWSGDATIGFKADNTYFRNHPLSGTITSNSIACVNYHTTDWSNVVYNLVPEGVEPCVPGEFGCDNGHCISDQLICNGIDDCGDNTDENGCPSGSCSPEDFVCDNGECIPLIWECDTIVDCNDTSDEDHCVNRTCGFEEFRCFNGTGCIPYDWVCDDYVDCPDTSDETVFCDCTSDEFPCNNGFCVHFALECDGNNDCGDNSDEDFCDDEELNPCPAMQSIVRNMEVADPSLFCTTADPCNTATCAARDGQKLQITLLNCNHPTAIRLINRDRNGPVLFNHTFNHSETVPAVIGGANVTLNVTIVHHSSLLGLRIEGFRGRDRATYIPYTLIRTDQTDCNPTSETSTCKAVQGVVHSLSETGWTCWTSDPCNVVNCIDEDGEQGLQMTFLACDDPQAVNWVMMYTRNVIWYNHTFTRSEVVTVYYSNHVMMLNVTLEQLKNGIGLEIQILANSSNPVSGFWEPFLPYTTIPLACPTPGSKSIIVPYTTGNSSYPTVTVLPNHKEKTGGLSTTVIIAIAASGGALLVIIAVIVVVILVCRKRRKKREQFEFQPMTFENTAQDYDD